VISSPKNADREVLKREDTEKDLQDKLKDSMMEMFTAFEESSAGK
jgi:hypothetical protein